MNPGFQMGSILECWCLWGKWVGRVNSVLRQDTLNREKMWVLFETTNANLLLLRLSILWQKKQKTLHYFGCLCWFQRCARHSWDITCTRQARLLLWGSEIWSQVATRDECRCYVDKNTSELFNWNAVSKTSCDEVWCCRFEQTLLLHYLQHISICSSESDQFASVLIRSICRHGNLNNSTRSKKKKEKKKAWF